MSRYDEVEDEYREDLLEYIEHSDRLNGVMKTFLKMDSHTQNLFYQDLLNHHSELEGLLRSIMNDEINGEGDRLFHNTSEEIS